jgi:tRNA (guanine-N7-)-methyltransferase
MSTHLRKIKSFVRREGRLTKGQTLALDTQWPQFGLQLEDGLLEFEKLFGRKAETILEIGFGMGDSLFTEAQREPDSNFIGIEVHRPGIGSLLMNMQLQDVNNIRLFDCDAVDVLKQCIPDNSLDKIQIFFPDPWHKKRHHKRRLIQPAFVTLLAQKLKTGGVLHLATDWQHYAEHMMEVMNASTSFENSAGKNQYTLRPASRPITKFEKRGLKLGHGVWDMIFKKT